MAIIRFLLAILVLLVNPEQMTNEPPFLRIGNFEWTSIPARSGIACDPCQIVACAGDCRSALLADAVERDRTGTWIGIPRSPSPFPAEARLEDTIREGFAIPPETGFEITQNLLLSGRETLRTPQRTKSFTPKLHQSGRWYPFRRTGFVLPA